MSALLRETAGVITVVDGARKLRTHHPNRKTEREYALKPDLIRPRVPLDELPDGAEATAVWNLGEARIEEVRVTLPEPTGPIPLERSHADGRFLNPYAFVSLPQRDDDHPAELKLGCPPWHDRYDPERWSGTIEVTITTRTPLLLPDHAAAAGDRRSGLPVRVDHLGRPMLAGSAVKGALRSAYEAITNSRLGVFGPHDRLLAMRAPADATVAALCPAWVTEVHPDGATLTVVRGLEPTAPGHKFDRPAMPAVWFPRRLIDPERHRSEPGGGSRSDLRGKRVEAWIRLALLGKTPLWEVLAWAEPGQLPNDPAHWQRTRGPQPVPGYPLVKVLGRVHWNGSSFPPGGKRKHDERLVVESVIEGPATAQIDTVRIDRTHVAAWQDVIDSYHRAHEHDRRPVSDYGDYVAHPARWRDLRVGDTLYVEFDQDGGVAGLYPAMIGRKPFPGPPSRSLPDSHRPARSFDEFSPADRVFGWVRDGADRAGTAYRAHLRVLPPDGAGIPPAERVHRFTPIPLAALASPKPTQFRFYLGDKDGGPLRSVGRTPADGYPAEPGRRRLRGRKVYLTHAEVLAGQPGAEEYWNPEARPDVPVPLAAGSRYRAFLRPADAEDTELDTWISGWVKPDTVFRVTLLVDNLSTVELGALLWLLDLPGDASMKLGLGKPLGFGAVRMAVDWEATRLYHGDRLRQRYEMIGPTAEPEPADRLRGLVDHYDQLLRRHLPRVRDEFLTAARGFTGVPVHYPRRTEKPTGKSFEWFTNNERGPRLPLGDLLDHEGLPLPYRLPRQRRQGKQQARDASPPQQGDRPQKPPPAGKRTGGNRPRRQRRRDA